MTFRHNPAVLAGALVILNVAVAVAVNILTSGWSWIIFVVLACLAALWVALASWQEKPRRSVEPLGSSAVPVADGTFVDRPEFTDRIAGWLVGAGARPIGITTGLIGAGGFGKTTLAQAVCRRADVKRMFGEKIYWVTIGQEVTGAALADIVNDVIERIEGQRPGFTRPEQAGQHLGDLLEKHGKSLLVIDDVWTVEQLRPFRIGGSQCTRLITTRIPDVLPDTARRVPVDQMNREQALALVTSEIPNLSSGVRDQLLELTGNWPLALGLVNGALRRAARDGADVEAMAGHTVRRLREYGLTALDVSDPARRERTVRATLEASLALLEDRRDRVVELAIFPEDVEIPQDLVAQLWGQTAGLDGPQTDRLCRELAELSLVVPQHERPVLRVHDVIRSYLRHECGDDRLVGLNDALLGATSRALLEHGAWWGIPPSNEYLWRNLAYHLTGAGRTGELAELVTEPRWVIAKLRRFGPVAVAEDLATVDTPGSIELGGILDQLGHLLTRTTPGHAVVNALAHRLQPHAGLGELREAALREVHGVARLVPRGLLPDMPDPALLRVLVGHEGAVNSCVFSPKGDWVCSAGDDSTVRIWDAMTGRLVRILRGHEWPVRHCAVSADGTVLATNSLRGVRLWDPVTWTQRAELPRSKPYINVCCFAANDANLVTSHGGTLRLWDVATLRQQRTYKGGSGNFYALSPIAGTSRLFGCEWDTVAVWDLAVGQRTVLPVDTFSYPRDCAVSPDGRWAAVAGSTGMSVYAMESVDRPRRTLLRGERLRSIAFSPDGTWVAAGGEDGTIRLVDAATWEVRGRIAAHAGEVTGLTISPDGSALASVGDDATVRLWDPTRAGLETRHTDRPEIKGPCISAPEGNWFATVREGDLVVYEGPPESVVGEVHAAREIAGVAASHDGAWIAIITMYEVLLCEAGRWSVLHVVASADDGWFREVWMGSRWLAYTDNEDRLSVVDTDRWTSRVVLEPRGKQLRIRGVPERNTKWRRLLRRAGNRMRQRFSKVIDAVAIPGGDQWIAVAVKNQVTILEPSTWQTRMALATSEAVEGLGASADGRRLASFGFDTCHVWDIGTGNATELTGHRGGVVAAAWAPTGRVLATVAGDRVIRIFDGDSLECLTEMRLDGDLSSCSWLAQDDLIVGGARGLYRFTFRDGSGTGR